MKLTFLIFLSIQIVASYRIKSSRSNIEKEILYKKEVIECVNTIKETKNTNNEIIENIFTNSCPKGQYFDYDTSIKINTFNCINCPLNTYKKDNKCVKCPPGYTSNPGEEQCTLCTEQMFKNKECKDIKQPSYAYCPSNTHISLDGCKVCPEDTFQFSLNQNTNCNSCPNNKKLEYSIFRGYYCLKQK